MNVVQSPVMSRDTLTSEAICDPEYITATTVTLTARDEGGTAPNRLTPGASHRLLRGLCCFSGTLELCRQASIVTPSFPRHHRPNESDRNVACNPRSRCKNREAAKKIWIRSTNCTNPRPPVSMNRIHGKTRMSFPCTRGLVRWEHESPMSECPNWMGRPSTSPVRCGERAGVVRTRPTSTGPAPSRPCALPARRRASRVSAPSDPRRVYGTPARQKLDKSIASPPLPNHRAGTWTASRSRRTEGSYATHGASKYVPPFHG